MSNFDATKTEPQAPLRMVNRIFLVLTTSKGFYGLLSVLVLAQFIIRGLLYPGAPNDDAEQLLFSQVFRWGYDLVNPPLYTWLVIAVQQIVGVENLTVSLVKFPAYWLIFHFLFVLGRRVTQDERIAVLAALSPLWLYYVAWDAVMSYSHTVLATALILAAFVAMLRLQDKGGVLSYALFGLVIGLGVLSKYTFILAALGMLIAGVINRPFRSRILHPHMFIAAMVAGVIITPHVYWLLQHSDTMGGAVSGKFGIGPADADFLRVRLKGLKSVFTSSLSFASPLWLVLLIIFWGPFRQRFKVHEYVSPSVKVLALYIFIVIILLGALVLLTGSTKIRAHYMFVLIPFPVLFFAWVKPSFAQSRRPLVFGISVIVMAFLLVGGMVGKYVSEPLRCKRCQLLMPYKDIGKKIRNAGFKGGTIFAYYFPHDLAGNLRSSFPDTRIVSTKFPSIASSPVEKERQCLIIWMPAPNGVMDTMGISMLANKYLETNIPLKDFPEKPLYFEFDRTTGRPGELRYMLFDPGRGTCR